MWQFNPGATGQPAARPAAAPAGFDPTTLPNVEFVFNLSAGGVYQTIDGSTTAATANSDPIGYIPDLTGNGYHLTCTADTAGLKPSLQGVGGNVVARFNGTSNVMRINNGFDFFENGGFGVFVALKPGTTGLNANDQLFGEGGTITLVIMCRQEATDGQSTTFVRASDGSTTMPTSGASLSVAGALTDSTDVVYGFVDESPTTSEYNVWVDGVENGPRAYTRGAETFTTDKFAFGADARTLASAFAEFDLYGAVGMSQAPTPTEIANITTWLGNLQGRSI